MKARALACLLATLEYRTMGALATSLASALEIIALNITAATALTKICLPFMQSASKIVEVSSVSSFAPNVNLLVLLKTIALPLVMRF